MDVVVSFTESDLVFIDSGEVVHYVADDDWTPEGLSRRDRMVLHGLLKLAIENLGAPCG